MTSDSGWLGLVLSHLTFQQNKRDFGAAAWPCAPFAKAGAAQPSSSMKIPAPVASPRAVVGSPEDQTSTCRPGIAVDTSDSSE